MQLLTVVEWEMPGLAQMNYSHLLPFTAICYHLLPSATLRSQQQQSVRISTSRHSLSIMLARGHLVIALLIYYYLQ